MVGLLLPASVLSSSPSSRDGVSLDVETTHRIFGCELVAEASIMLELPQVASATAQTLLQRFFYRESLARFDAFEVALACVFLAAKIEERPRQLDDVLNVFQRLLQKRRSLPYVPLATGTLRHTRWKAAMLRNEMCLLKELGFSLYDIMDHPHKFVLYYVRALAGGHALAQKAWNFLNDSLRIDLCVRFRSEVIASASIYYAAREIGAVLPTGPGHPPWWTLFGATEDEMRTVCLLVLSLYRRPTVGWVESLRLDLRERETQEEAEFAGMSVSRHFCEGAVAQATAVEAADSVKAAAASHGGGVGSAAVAAAAALARERAAALATVQQPRSNDVERARKRRREEGRRSRWDPAT